MTTRFDRQGLAIVLRARVGGVRAERPISLMLDTGASFSLVRPRILRQIGAEEVYGRVAQPIVTITSVVTPPAFMCSWLAALGMRRNDFVVIAYELPRAAPVDGLLGLDFLRDTHLRIDFRAGTIDLT